MILIKAIGQCGDEQTTNPNNMPYEAQRSSFKSRSSDMKPFGTPVLPEVNMMVAMSVGFREMTGDGFCSPCIRIVRFACACGYMSNN